MELFWRFVFFWVGAVLSRVSTFFLNAVERNVETFHLASFDSGWNWSVTRDLMVMSPSGHRIGAPVRIGHRLVDLETYFVANDVIQSPIVRDRSGCDIGCFVLAEVTTN